MNTSKKLEKVFALAVMVVLALPFVTRESTSLRAQRGRQHVMKFPQGAVMKFPQAAVNIVQGQKLRTTLVNRGTSPILGVVVSVFDRNGMLVREDTRDVAPGAMEFSDVTCSVPRPPNGIAPPPPTIGCPGVPEAAQADDGSTPLRTEVAVQPANVRDLLITTAVVSERNGTAGPGYVMRLAANHNETLVRDAALMH